MPRIIAAGHALPPHVVSQKEVRKTAERLFTGKIANLKKLLALFDRCRIEERQFMRPLEWYLAARTPSERNRVYQEDGMELLSRAARNCLAAAGMSPDRVDHLIFVSSTGHATPTLDARLINVLGMRPSTTRLPIWGLGCAGGAAGLARAFDHCRAHPRAAVLLNALECCSLTFCEGDLSKKNLVATALFADGAAAVLVVGDEVDLSGPEILATGSHLFPDSYRIMGWDFLDDGMQLVLSPKLPSVVKQALPALIDRFMEGQRLQRSDLVHYVTHPGGAKVLDAYGESLSLALEELEFSAEVLRRHGNISSVTVLVILEKWLNSPRASRPGHGLLSAFGPGFSAELVLFRV
jgi:alkylresorcinol/alkylpyrone synthase